MIDGVPIFGHDLTAWGMVGAVVLMVLTGLLIPRWFYKALERQATKWQDTATTALDTNAVQARTIEKQLVVADTIERIMNSLPNKAVEHEPSD